MLTVCKQAFPDSHIASKLSMKRTKISYVMQNGIAFHEKLEVKNICKESKFSIMIDESTDISVTQILAVVAQYFDSNKHDVVDALLDTIEVENGTAQHLYQVVKSLLKKRGISFENMVGFGSDNCSTMMGERSVCFFVLFAIFILHSRESELYRYTLDDKSALAWELPFSRFMGHLSST